ncbi:MAG: electron transport complex subunit E [Candidatus Izimaplasma sp.]|nr:electron transport complex subunit E [Candidatus Izimaplasma bacterium]
MTKKENFLKGLIKENPIFVFLLGMCPALAVTSTFETALGMGILVIFVLTGSNFVVSLVRKYIPHEIRTPSYIVIIATFVTIVEMITEAYTYDLYIALGIFIPLIVVNCLILGRAESFASKNKVIDSVIDGIGMALGFTIALITIGVLRELLATGTIQYGVYLPFFVEEPISLIKLFPKKFGLTMFSLPPGAFIALGIILAISQFRKVRNAEKKAKEKKAFIEQKKKEALERKRQAKMQKAGDNK